MTINHKIWDFPQFPISGQVFHVPGAGFDGGYTSGGAKIFSPEPGGRAILEMQLSMQVEEWESPLSSWIMSKTNGDIFRIKLAKTPQLVLKKLVTNPNGVPWNNDQPWNNGQPWDYSNLYVSATIIALEGTTTITADMALFGRVLKHGHVIGHKNHAYKVDDISYSSANIATITVVPPLRKSIAVDDKILFDPFFLGVIANGDEMKSMYEAANNGAIQLNRILFSEVII